MKKLNLGFAVIMTAVALLSGGCQKKATMTLKIGATPVPHAELLNLIADDLGKDGIKLEVMEFNDYVMPNTALLAGEIDANFMQHLPYLESNDEWMANLTPVFGVHIEPFGLYSNRYASIGELLAAKPQGAQIALPNDPTNGGRAYLLLEANGLIKLRDGAGITATDLDVVENPNGFKFIAVEAAQLPRTLDDVDAACINGNFAMDAGKTTQDALIIEGSQSPYVNVVVVQNGNETDPRIVSLKKALLSQKVKDYINEKWVNGTSGLSVIPIF
jgi:D-methionine transport system substrate-binding protein